MKPLRRPINAETMTATGIAAFPRANVSPTQNQAATCVQAVVRGYLQRGRYMLLRAKAQEQMRLRQASAVRIQAAFRGPWADSYPPVLTPDQLALLCRVSKKTIYGRSSEGRR